MRENFNLLLIQLFFLNLFYLKKSKLYFASLGFIGYSAMTSSIWMIMLITLIVYIFINFEINKIRIYSSLFVVLVFFLFTIFPLGKNRS